MNRLFYVLIILLIFNTAGVFSQDNRSYEQIAKSPKTVADYFLICPEISIGSAGGLNASDINIIPDQSMVFYERKRLLVGASEPAYTITNRVIDIPNGYIKIESSNDRSTATLIFVIFERADKSIVPAYSFLESGPEGEIRKCVFFDLRNYDWTRYKMNELFPQVDVAEFSKNKTDITGKFAAMIDWDYILPQNGTTVYLVPRMINEHDFFRSTGGTPGDLKAYINMMKKLSSRALEMKWNREKSRFSKGRLIKWKY